MPYAELLYYSQPNQIRKPGFTRIRDAFPDLAKYVPLTSDQSEFVGHRTDPEPVVEFAGRWDYGLANAQRLGQTAKDGTPIIEKWMSSGEESMIEMSHAIVFVECSRVVSHEFVRHRLFSFQQESQRFTKYDDANADELFYVPLIEGDFTEAEYHDDGSLCCPAESNMDVMRDTNERLLAIYREMRKDGVAPQLARYILPNGTLTRMVVGGNLREWRHFLKLRTHKSVQPEMRELALMIHDQLIEVYPTLLKGVISDERGVR